MATETGPDLSAGQAAVEALMDDTCQIRRPGAEASEEIDPDTLALVAEAQELTYDGRCLIGTANRPGSPLAEVGGDQRGLTGYTVSLPLAAAPDLRPGDLVTCTSSRRDPGLAGLTFVVDEVSYKTMAVSRKAQMTLGA